MERKQVIVQRAHEFFGDRLDQVLRMVQQDRQDLRGWQEPAHLAPCCAAPFAKSNLPRGLLSRRPWWKQRPFIGLGNQKKGNSAKRWGKFWKPGQQGWKRRWQTKRQS